MEKEAKQSKHVKAEAKQIKQKLGFLGSGLHVQEQAYMHIIKPVCTCMIMCTQALA